MLPDLIEIVPLDKPVQAQITVPGSKSITNRALILAALAKGETTLRGALWSEDTQVMVECLQKLGFNIKLEPDPDEFCNCTITVQGLGGKIPNAGTKEKPLELFVGNAGTAARFLSALVCLGNGVYRLHGVPRMHERPQSALFHALWELGYRIESTNEKLPAIIYGTGPRKRRCKISIEESSQFASALMLCQSSGGWEVDVVGVNADESPYVAMTMRLIETMPEKGEFWIELDASSGSYFEAARYVVAAPTTMEFSERFGIEVETSPACHVQVSHWPTSSWQIDANFPSVFMLKVASDFGIKEILTEPQKEMAKEFLREQTISRGRELGDSIMTAIVLAPLAAHTLRFTDLACLRVQECERVEALRTELTKCGAKVIEKGDTLEVFPSELHGAEIETYNDHRMAMCFAILGLKIAGIKIKNPACVKKTFPNFFQKLAAAPPCGLGATILDARTGRPLAGEELFAD